MKKRLLFTWFMLLTVVGTWAENNESEPVVSMTCATSGAVIFKLYATEDVTLQIDFGQGATDKTVTTAGTTISGSSPVGSIQIYGDAAKIKKFESSSRYLRTVDVSKCSGLVNLVCTSSNYITEIILPDAADKLETLAVNSNKLISLDVSRYTKLKDLNCRSNAALARLVLPSVAENELTGINCGYTNLTSLDASKCSKLKTLEVSNTDAFLATLLLPENADVLSDLTLKQCGLTSLDVSSYINLTNLDCTFNYLTSIQIPESPANNLTVDCSSNLMIMPGFPEGENVRLYYVDQREKVSSYELAQSYTTNDVIDLSGFHVLKKGVKGSYYPQGVYPTFTWYVKGIAAPLEEGKDYTAVAAGKFRFNVLPQGSVYCVIASAAYPDYQSYNSPYKTTDVTIEQEKEPVLPAMTLVSEISDKKINLVFQATEDGLPVQIDWGSGDRTDATVNVANTTLSGTPAGTVIIYGDASKLKYAKLSGCGLTSADFGKASGLETLELVSNSGLATLVLPQEVNTLKSFTLNSSLLENLNLAPYLSLTNISLLSNGSLAGFTLPEAVEVLKYNSQKLTAMLDLSPYKFLTVLECSSNGLLSEIRMPGEESALTSLIAKSNKLVTLDVSKCTKLMTLDCQSNPLIRLILPPAANELVEIRCKYADLVSLDISKCAKLEVLEISNKSAAIETLILPDHADVLRDITLIQCGLTALDVSKYVNLTNLDCTFNYLTTVRVPENPNNVLSVDCSSNYMFLPAFPEGEKITLYYIDQREKVSKYTLKDSYTTKDVIDLSELYVSKKGVAGSYFPEGVFPTFTWYVEGKPEALKAGVDYQITGGGKFRFDVIPEGNIYCVIASAAYPTYQQLNVPYRSTSTFVVKAPDPILSMTCSATHAVSFKLYATEDSDFRIETDEGLADCKITVDGTVVSGTFAGGFIRIYGDAAKLKKFESSDRYLQTLDFSKCHNLTDLACSSNNAVTEIILPSAMDKLQSLIVNNNNLTTLDVSRYLKLKELNCRSNMALTQLILPSEENQLTGINSLYTNLTSLDASKCSRLKTLEVSNGDAALTALLLPENPDALSQLALIQCGLETLDVSQYVNLTNLDCTYNFLTSIRIPEVPAHTLDIDCSYNLMVMPGFPEGEKITMAYIYQREKVMKYELAGSYTTDDMIDFSTFYVAKKGLMKSYFPEGVYPAFDWYLEKTNEKLVAGKDYTITDGCKFRFVKVPEGSVYCVISSMAYPAYTELNEPYKSTVCTITPGSGIQMTNSETAEVYVDHTRIVIASPYTCTYSVATITGQAVAAGKINGITGISVTVSGVYVVRIQTAGNRDMVYKVVVR